MKRRILSLFLALSMLTPVLTTFSLTSSAANTDISIELYSDLGNILTLDQYDEQIEWIANQIGTDDPSVLVENEDYVNVLLRRKLTDKVGYDTFAAQMNQNPDFAACMEWLYNDTQMLHYYMYGGEPEANGLNSRNKQPASATYISSLNVLTKLYTKHKEDMNDETNAPLYKRMMAAIALTHSVPVYAWVHFTPLGARQWIHQSEPVGRYELFKKLYNFGFLAYEFDKYNVEEMRMVMNSPLDNAQLEWLHHYYRVKYLKNPDYAEHVVQATSRNVGGAPVKYGTTDKNPKSNPELFDSAYFDQWNEKYMLSVHNDYFDFDVDYGLNEKGQYYEAQWITIERTGVCSEISYTGSVIKNAFGIASRYLHQPLIQHMSYLVYNWNEGNPALGSGYDISGVVRSGFVYEGYTHVFADWSNFGYDDVVNSGSLVIGMEAVYNKHDTDYEKAENLVYLADIQAAAGNYVSAVELYNKALEAQYFHLEAFVKIGRLYEKMGKTDDDYFELALCAGENLKYYPHPMYSYMMNVIYPKIQDDFLKTEIISMMNKKFDEAAATAGSAGLIQPSLCTGGVSYARSLLKKIAAFSFDSGIIALGKEFTTTGKDLLYSFDKGETWNRWEYEEGANSHKLTPEEIAQITDANDIWYKFDTSEYTNIIAIGTQSRPVSNNNTNRPNDDEDKFLFVQKGLEYSTDEGETWNDLTSDILFTGDVTVWVRKKTAGVFLAGPHFEIKFTKATDTPERRYLKLSGNVKITTPAPAYSSLGPYGNALDTRPETYWVFPYHNPNYSRELDESGNLRPAYKGAEFVFEIGDPNYISAIGYIPALRADAGDDGTIKECEVYTSNDKVNWHLAGSTDSWSYVKTAGETYPREQFIDFDKPAYTKYVKIKVKKAGSKAWNGMIVGYATAAEFKLYKNETCPDKDVARLSLTVDPSKTNYKIGDKIDVNSITADLRYTDGTSSSIPADALEFDVNVFDSTDIKEVNASFKGSMASFPVTVSENDRVATQISGTTVTDRKYYAQDAFEKENVLVQVTDGTNKWYLLPEEFEFENPILATGANTLKILHNNLSATFSVNAEKAAKELRIDTDESFKTQYFIGDTMDLDGMSVNLVYTDGSEKLLDSSEYDLTLTKDGNVPITSDIFARTAGTKTIKATLKNKEEINGALDVTVFTYITSGDFAFEALAGETSCKLTGFTPSGDISDTTINIPETVAVGGYTYKVEEIAVGAFDQAPQMYAVSIPKTIKKIESGAFGACTNLVNVYMTDHTSFDGFVCENEAFAEVANGYVYVKKELVDITSPIPGYQVADIINSARSLSITPPAKTQYILGEEFDKTGMAVSIVLHDGSYVETTAYTMRGFYSTVTGELTITVTLNENPRISGTFKVNVGFPPITISKQPIGATYAVGDVINPISVEASIKEGLPLMYKWYRSETNDKNGSLIENATKAEYEPTDGGYYYAAIYTADKNNNESEPVYSDAANIMVGEYEAIVGTTGYASLKQAMLDAPEGSTVRVCKDLEINERISLSGKKLILDGQGHTLKRAKGYLHAFMSIFNNSVVTLKNIVFDGGAVWTGNEDPVLKRGLTNSGLQATCPFVLAYAGTELRISDGAILQNNYNRATSANESTGTNLTGGAIWGIDATITLDGGTITNNASTVFGSAIYLRGYKTSSFVSNKGEVSYNHDPNPTDNYNASAICADNNSTANIIGGTFKNNKGGSQGSVFWIGIKTLIISGGTFENNYTDGSGGVGYFNTGASVGNLNVSNATFKNNYAGKDAGVFYCCNKAIISNSTFENNTAGQNGGVFYIPKESIDSSGNVYRGNKAIGDGGIVYTPVIFKTTQDTFENNTAAHGGTVCLTGTASQLQIGDLQKPLKDVYMYSFKYVYITAMRPCALLMIDTPTEITSDTVVASSQYAPAMDIRINGYKTLLDGQNYVNAYKGYVFKPIITPRVTYNKNGGVIDNETQYTIFNAGEGLILPVAHKDGYIFDGWFDNADLTGMPVTEIGTEENTDKAFWAKWSIAEYSVTLNTDGGTLAEALDKYIFGEGAILPVPTKDGYNFAGWFDNAELTGTPVTEIGAVDFGAKEYWAKWAENEYLVTLNTNGGTLTETMDKYTYGVGAVLPIPSKDDHTFAGWFDNEELTGSPVTQIGAEESGNKEYWAKWTINSQIIRFVNHNNRLLQEVNVEIGQLPEYTGREPVKDPDDKYTYTFAGWDPEIVPVSGDATYTAIYTQAPRVFSLMLNLNSGILDNEEKYTQYTYGQGIVLPTPDRDEYVFEGWFDNKELSGEPVTAVDADATGNKSFYAKWSYIMPTEFTITFINYNNKTLWFGNFPVGEIPEYRGEPPQRASDDKYTYEFIGWDKELTEVSEAASYVAQFKRTPIKYFIEYTEDNKILAAAPEAGECDLILAAYDSNGRLKSIESVSLVFDDAGEQTVIPQALNIDGAAKVKAILWDSLNNMTPKCEAILKNM